MTAKLPILPGEDEAELHRRLEVWPEILGAETEIEHFEAIQVVHIAWRRARSLRSDDAAAERRMIAIKKAHTDRQAEEARLLGVELDSDVDPKSLVRKLCRTPAGCTLLLSELRGFSDCLNKYGVLFWAQRERFFHCLGRRLRDFFTNDRVITDWVVALMGAVFGDLAPEEKLREISAVLEGLRPAWMDPLEYQIRMEHLVKAVAGREASIERVKSDLEATIGDLKKRLKRAQANSRRELKLELESAWVDDTVAGARRLRYRLGHDRAYETAWNRLEKSKKARREEGSPADDPEDQVEPDSGGATEGGVAVATPRGKDGPGGSGLGVRDTNDPAAGPTAADDPSAAPVTDDPVSPLPGEPLPPSPIRPDGIVENEPILAASTGRDGMGTRSTAVGVTVDMAMSSAPATENAPLLPAAEDRLDSVTNEPISPLLSEPLPLSPAPQLPSPIPPPEGGAGPQRAGEPPPDRPPG
jgi:hypothetical protein